MSDADRTPNTNDLLFWVQELQNGRPGAAEPVFRKIAARVEKLTRAMFRKFPRVGRFVDVEDVIQNSLIRLLAAFRQVRPSSRQHFYTLTNELIRRELLDLAKHYYGPHGHGRHLSEMSVGDGDREHAPADNSPDPGELDRMAAFHEAVKELPVEEREVIGLTYYHGWTQGEIADLFQVSIRTVQRWHESGVTRLRRLLPADF